MAQVQQRILIIAALGLSLIPSAGAKRFYDDDPVLVVPKPRNVGEIRKRNKSEIYDYFANTFGKPGEKQIPPHFIRAQGINTLDEVPDSEWFTNRHGKKRMSIEELVRGAGYSAPPSQQGQWEVTAAKTEGVTPGFTIKDSTGHRYQLKFDLKANYELGTGADVMGSKFFWAFGYWAPQNFIVYFPLEQLRVASGTKFTDKRGEERDLQQSDIDDIMEHVPTDSQRRYRAIASAFLPGKPVGPFRYDGVRFDDPNDYVPHEHRRELRALRVFSSWVNHTDAKALQSLDTIIEDGGVKYLRHNLLDFSADFGAEAFEPKSPRAGYVYLLDWPDSARSFFTFGLAAPAWTRAHYEHVRGVGRMEANVFDPEKWKPNYYSPAFKNLLPDDAFWAAKIIMKFTEPEVKAILDTSAYSDKEGLKYLLDVMMKRQKKIGQTWFSKVLPLDEFRIENGRLAFEDLGVTYGFHPARQYTFNWFDFNNDSGQMTPIGGAGSAAVPKSRSAYTAATIHAGETSKAVTVFLRRRGADWQVVGIERSWPGKTT